MWAAAYVKVLQISHFCLYRLQMAKWLTVVEHRVRNTVHDSHTHKDTEIISFSAQQGNPFIHSHGSHKNGKRCPWCLKEKWPVKSQPFPCTACSSWFSVTLSHMDRLIWPNTELESAYMHDYNIFELLSMIKHCMVCINLIMYK